MSLAFTGWPFESRCSKYAPCKHLNDTITSPSAPVLHYELDIRVSGNNLPQKHVNIAGLTANSFEKGLVSHNTVNEYGNMHILSEAL